MFAFDLVAEFEKTMKNGKKRKRDAADCRAEQRAEKRAEDENYKSARAARQNSPEQTDERQS